MGRYPTRSDIPYAARLLMDKFNSIKEHRDDAARVALKCMCVALNDVEGIGLVRLVRVATRVHKLIDRYYSDPEVEGTHLNERLTQIGFKCDGDRMFAALDEDGEAVKGVF